VEVVPLKPIPVELTHNLSVVMPGPVPGTHVFRANQKGVDGRDKPFHAAAILTNCVVTSAMGLRGKSEINRVHVWRWWRPAEDAVDPLS
jgi:hypothetical protein